MKAIMISIKPKWVAKILNGEKTIEIRKRFPKNFRGWVYIYCTKENDLFKSYIRMGYYTTRSTADDIEYNGKGKIVARFYCDNVEKIYTSIIPNLETKLEEDNEFNFRHKTQLTESLLATDFLKQSCLSIDDLEDYFTKWEYDEFFGDDLIISDGCAIHISDLEIFGKPKELSEFSVRFPEADIKFKGVKGNMLAYKPLTKAPQSWQFIEVDE